MSASDHVSKAQSGKYVFHEAADYGATRYHVYKGDERVGALSVEHDLGEEEYDPDYGPRAHQVGYMSSVKGHSAAVMTALGIAQERAVSEGSKLTPSDDLSPYSSRLVGHLQRRGLVTGHHSSEQTNNSAHMVAQSFPVGGYRPGRPLNTSEVDNGRQFIRKALKNGRLWE